MSENFFIAIELSTHGTVYLTLYSLRHQLIIMAALRSRCRHYIFALWFLSIFFIPRLISAVADWMSTILRHMMWP